MKMTIPLLTLALALTGPLLAESPSPTASPAASAKSSPAADAASGNTDVYHVHIAKSAVGKASAHGEALKKQDPEAPMPGHRIILRHQSGDSWDYCVIEHLGSKATIEATPSGTPPPVVGLNEWHNDTYVSGPAWAQFAKEMGLDDPSKSAGAAYNVSIYRAATGQRETLEKFLNEPPDRASDSTVGNVTLVHIEGAAWTFMKISRNSSWADYGKDMTAGVAAMSKPDGGWFKLRDAASFHTDTACDRMAP